MPQWIACSMILQWCVPCTGDSSEAEEEGGESGEGEDDTAIICGLGVKMKVIKDGKYRSVNSHCNLKLWFS